MNIKKFSILMGVMVFSLIISLVSVVAEGNETNITQEGDLIIEDMSLSVDYEVTSAHIDANLEDSQNAIQNGSKIDAEIFPGSTLRFEFDVENTYEHAPDGEDDIVIDDVYVTGIIKEIGVDEEDLDDESQELELEPNEEGTLYLEFTIPQLVLAKTYELIIDVEGDGTDGKLYKVHWELDLPVKKQSHDLRVKRVVLEDTSLECTRNTHLTASIYNAGRQHEDEVRLEIVNEHLGLDEIETDIELGTELDEDISEAEIEYSKKFPVRIADDIEAGKYPIDVNVYYKTVIFNTKQIELEIKDCALFQNNDNDTVDTTTTTTVADEPVQGTTTTTTPSEGTVMLTGGVVVDDNDDEEEKESIFVSKEFSLKNSPFYIPLLLGTNLLVLVIVIGLGVVLATKLQE